MKKSFVIFALTALLSGCVLFHGYVPPVQQGNIITPQAVAKLHLGMSQDEVLAIMGSPVLTNTFRNNRWDYVYTYQVYGRRITEEKVIIHFQNGRVSGVEKALSPRLPAYQYKQRGFLHYHHHRSDLP